MKSKVVCIRDRGGKVVCGTPVHARENPDVTIEQEQHARSVGDQLGIDWMAEQERNITPAAVYEGMQVETEHSRPRGSVLDVARGDERTHAAIALAHLRERPDYYELLRKHVEDAPLPPTAATRTNPNATASKRWTWRKPDEPCPVGGCSRPRGRSGSGGG